MIAHFIQGLERKIGSEMWVLHPVDKEKALDMALRVEENLMVTYEPRWSTANQHISRNYPNNHNSPNTQNTPSPSRTFIYYKNLLNSHLRNNPQPSFTNHKKTQTHENTRRLSDREFQETKERRLCFRCDEKWQIGHVCKRRELCAFIVGEEKEIEESREEDWEDAVETVAVDDVMNVEGQVSISLNSVVGINNPKTMKLLGKVKGVSVVIMVDLGATNNFISLNTIATLNISIEPTDDFHVTLGTGDVRKDNGICKEVELDLGALIISENFLPLGLGHSDIILGLEWLAKLGTIATNWKIPLMQFSWKG